jgi:hypothetical protein
MRHVWLGAAVVPYLALAAVDAWMHERARRVPRVEQGLHAGLAITITVFLVAAFAGRTSMGWIALACFLCFLVADELGFHRGIDPRERRVHVASWAALVAFVLIWHLTLDRS